MKKSRFLLALLLSVSLIFTMMPFSVYAEGGEPDGSYDNPYVIDYDEDNGYSAGASLPAGTENVIFKMTAIES